MIPEPMSTAVELFLLPNNPNRPMPNLRLRDKEGGRRQTTVSPAPYPVKPRTYLRPLHHWSARKRLSSPRHEVQPPLDHANCCSHNMLCAYSLEQLDPPARAHRRDHRTRLEHRLDGAIRVIDVGLARDRVVANGHAILDHRGTPEVRGRAATASGGEGTPDDRDPEELEGARDIETPVDQQNPLPLPRASKVD